VGRLVRVLLGAAETPDLRFASEAGIAHVRTCRPQSAARPALLVGLGLVPAGLLFAAGVFARPTTKTIRSRALGAAAPTSLSSVRGDANRHRDLRGGARGCPLSAARWLQARAQLARLQPGQRRKAAATV